MGRLDAVGVAVAASVAGVAEAVLGFGGVAAENSMVAKGPEIARLGPGSPSRIFEC
jgi:hypothetical protein